MKTNLMHYLSLVYFVNQPLHVSDMFVAHHQEVTIHTQTYTYIYMYIYNNWYVLCFLVDCLLAGQQSTEMHNTYQLLCVCVCVYIYIYICIQYTSWWWATNTPETCRGWLTKSTDDKYCIKLVYITRMYRDGRSTEHKVLVSSVCACNRKCKTIKPRGSTIGQHSTVRSRSIGHGIIFKQNVRGRTNNAWVPSDPSASTVRVHKHKQLVHNSVIHFRVKLPLQRFHTA